MPIANDRHCLQNLQRLDHRHFMHPWQGFSSDQDAESRMNITRAHGIYVYDDKGQRYIDGPGGMWNMQIGYGRAEMAKAIHDQAMQLAYHSPFHATAAPAILLAQKLAQLAPGDLNRVFYTNSGSAAIDSAIRFVHFYHNLHGRPDKKTIIARAKSYHGSTLLAASLSGRTREGSRLDAGAVPVHFVGDLDPANRLDSISEADRCKAELDQLEQTILDIGACKVAAFISEPVQASGGVVIAADGYHEGAHSICSKHDVLYISDEVVTGFGRLGHWFASRDVFGIQPDIITIAKGLTSGYQPLGAMLVSDRLVDELQAMEAQNKVFTNGFTYAGHPVCCAAALKNIEVIEHEQILDHVRAITPLFQARLQDLQRFDCVGDVRGIGLLGCLEGKAQSGVDEAVRLRRD
ncbi:MAG: aminotransferase class III-fold pyridoxal phosphate-dependent enzyme, partial [Pseudomonadota bacterium]